MATYRRRGNRWQVQIRRTDQPNLSRSFTSKADAQRWARQMEAQLDRSALPHDYRKLEATRLSEILTRYRDEIVPQKRGWEVETVLINAFLRQPLAQTKLSHLAAKAFASYRDDRMKTVRPASILRELCIIQHALDIAMKEWGFPLAANPVKAIRKPRLPSPRGRRVTHEEVATLLDGARKSRNPHLAPAITLAVETGMRRGELLGLCWKDINFKERLLHIPETKNGHPRDIPLSSAALATLESQQSSGLETPLPLSVESLKKAWQRLLRRTGMEGLRFHDLRHEAVSRFFELGLSMPEVALISGHRDPRMLFRYTHLDPRAVGKKLT